MAAFVKPGQTSWSGVREPDGHRTYTLKSLVVADKRDGPSTVLTAIGLPLPGTTWLVDDDLDLYAICTFEAKVTPRVTDEPNFHWDVEQKFTTRPQNRCFNDAVGNPLTEPMKVSGSFTKFTEEASEDLYGNPIRTSSFETIRGKEVEFDSNRPTVHIEQNVADLELPLLVEMMRGTVNDDELWGLPAGTVHLSSCNWERCYLDGCDVYYKRVFDFEIKEDGWARDLVDEGTKALNGHWEDEPEDPDDPDGPRRGSWVLDDIGGNPPNPSNPNHFIRFQDRNGNNARVILDGNGVPFNPDGPPPVSYLHATAVARGAAPAGAGLDNPAGASAAATSFPGSQEIGTWNYEVSAVKGGVESIPSNAGSVTTTTSPHLSTRITWEAVPGATEYRVYAELVGVDSGTGLIASVTAATSEIGNIHVEKYAPADYLLLGLPTSF